ncbi:MAG: efflux RND transporter permease subunit, partial [Flavobacteriales bacterium]|nr:efflux RND transporter permease subunit [Flavobacteriales bacterium]
IGFKLFPTSEKPIFLINLRMPQQTSLQESDRITKMVEDSLSNYEDIKYFTSNVGKGNPQIYYNVVQQEEKYDFAQIFVQLDQFAKPNLKTKVIDQLRDQFETFPHARVEVRDFEQGPPIEAPISIRVFGEDLDTLRRLSFEVQEIIRTHPGSAYVNNELNAFKTDLKLNIDRDKARTLGVLTSDIDQTVRMAVAGVEVGTFSEEEGDDYSIMVNAPREDLATLDLLDNLFINNVQGTPVKLDQLAYVDFETSPSSVNHFNKKRFAKVTSYTKSDVLANDILEDIKPALAEIQMPEGYYYAFSGEAESEGDAFGGGFITVILLTVFLFIAVLILQFKTFKGILIVLSVIPLGVIGGVSMLLFSGNPMSFIAIIGFIGLAGIEVKNSILLVDFTNQLREEGVALNDAILKAGELRFLPVVLTSLTAIGGLIPLAVNPNPQISPLALVLIGGLISSTLLSRIVTPVMYKLIPPKIEVQKVES